MMFIEDRQRQWFSLPASTAVHPTMTFVDDRLELGAGTVLARLDCDGLDLDGKEARLLALLSAAYQRTADPSILSKLRLAGREWRKGEACLAQIHLVLSGLQPLARPNEAAYRLFLADGLMAHGMRPRDIMKALDLDPSVIDGLEKLFNSDEARVPKGSGRPSGRWTGSPDGIDAEGAGQGYFDASPEPALGRAAAASSAASFFEGEVAAEVLTGLGEMAAGLRPPP